MSSNDSPPQWRHDAPDFVPRPWASQITFTPGGFQPTVYGWPPWSPGPELDFFDPVERVSHQQLLQVVLHSKQRLIEDLESPGWVAGVRAFMQWACGDAAAEPPTHDSPFSHPFTAWLIPPPRLRYIHPSIMDAALYALRNPKNETPTKFELSACGEAGFENGLRGDWLIALIGFFYYALPPLRLALAKHICREPLCWACELSFVFRSLDVGSSEGNGQPVRTDKFCDALFRSAPTTLGLSKLPENDFNPSVNCEDVRVSHQLRLAFSSHPRPWIRARSQRRQKSSPVDLDPLDDQRRERVAKAVRRTEAEKRAERDQKLARQKLHYRCHQVMNYLLHALESIEKDGPLFCIQVETETVCRTASSVVPTPAYVLELDHSPWVTSDAGSDQEMSSYPVSTAHSFRNSGGSRAASSSSLSSSRSASQRSSFESAAAPRVAARPVSFADLLSAALWKTSQVQMVCSHCVRSSTHTVIQKVRRLPPVLAVKVKLYQERPAGVSEPLRFWRAFRKKVPLPWWRLGWNAQREVSTLFARGLHSPANPDDDGDMARLMGHWLRLHRGAQTKRGSRRKLRALTATLTSALSEDASPLPSRVYIRRCDTANSDNPWQVADARDGAQGAGWERFDLIGVVVSVNHVWSRVRRATAWRMWTHAIARQVPTDELPRLFNRLEAEETTLEAPPNEDQLITYVRRPGDGRWLMINGPVVAEASEEETRIFALPWKFPCALFFGRTSDLWTPHLLRRLPPPPPPLPPAADLFADHCVSQTPLALRRPPRFTPLSPDEIHQIEEGNWTIAIDAEHVVTELLKKSPTSLLARYPQLSLARLSLVRAHGGPKDGTPFLDPYVVFREEPLDYRTEFSGLYPGDLDLNGSVHYLCTFKHVYQVMRFLVQCKCKFIGHDLFNDFRVLGLIVPHDQIVDTVVIFRRSLASRFLSLKFLCHHILNMDIQQYTHDSIEDAQAALALYRFYLEYVSEHSIEEFREQHLERIYKIGYQTSFKIAPPTLKMTAEDLEREDH